MSTRSSLLTTWAASLVKRALFVGEKDQKPKITGSGGDDQEMPSIDEE
jgi:hypothetical protein